MKVMLAIFIGGGLGSVARYLTARLALSVFESTYPLGTFLANLASCILLGIFMWLISKGQLNGFWIPFLVIGFCGGYSTFSTFSFETLQLIQEGRWDWAILNIVVSLTTCILVLFVLSKQLK